MPTDDELRTGPVRIGTRGSDLARWQANHVADALRAQWGDALDVRIEVIKTEGDRIQDKPLHEVGGKGLFVRAIEERLLGNEVDLAIHSYKDLPALTPDGLVVACTPAREDPRDALVTGAAETLRELPEGTRLGTTSLRRGALAKRINPGIEVVSIRGNVPTRLRKLDDGEVDAVMLACAGLRRLGLAARITEALEVGDFIPAACQGILAIECRDDDERMRGLVGPLADAETTIAASAERAFLRRLGADCTVPVGCHAHRRDDALEVLGVVVHPSSKPCFISTKLGDAEDAAKLGTALAEGILGMGAGSAVDGLADA